MIYVVPFGRNTQVLFSGFYYLINCCKSSKFGALSTDFLSGNVTPQYPNVLCACSSYIFLMHFFLVASSAVNMKDSEWRNPQIAASTLKQYLLEMPSSIIPPSFYENFIVAASTFSKHFLLLKFKIFALAE